MDNTSLQQRTIIKHLAPKDPIHLAIQWLPVGFFTHHSLAILFDINGKPALNLTPYLSPSSITRCHFTSDSCALLATSIQRAIYAIQEGGQWIVKKRILSTITHHDSGLLINAITDNNPYLAELLIKAGINVNEPSGDTTPLCIAVELGNMRMIKVLIKSHADINATTIAPLHPPLYIAFIKQNEGIIDFLLKSGAKLPPQDDLNILIYNTVASDNVELTTLLMFLGANPIWKAPDGKTVSSIARSSDTLRVLSPSTADTINPLKALCRNIIWNVKGRDRVLDFFRRDSLPSLGLPSELTDYMKCMDRNTERKPSMSKSEDSSDD